MASGASMVIQNLRNPRLQRLGNQLIRTASNHHLGSKDPLIRPYFQRRSVVTTALVEPPLDVSERPYTVVVAMDPSHLLTAAAGAGDALSSLDNDCAKTFCDLVPPRLGMACTAISWTSSPYITATHWLQWMENEGLAELQADLQTNLQQQGVASSATIILITYGPLSSWMAQWYLESHALAGLVMINPMVLVDEPQAVLPLASSAWKMLFGQEEDSACQFHHHDQQRPLLLEPWSVPMMVVHTTTASPAWDGGLLARHARATAHRHGGQPLMLHASDDDNHNIHVDNNKDKGVEDRTVVPVIEWNCEANVNDSVHVMVETILRPWIESRVF